MKSSVRRRRDDLISKSGEVIAYDFDRGHGKISLTDGSQIDFHCTSFQSLLPIHFPTVGNRVIVIFQQHAPGVLNVVRVREVKK